MPIHDDLTGGKLNRDPKPETKKSSEYKPAGWFGAQTARGTPSPRETLLKGELKNLVKQAIENRKLLKPALLVRSRPGDGGARPYQGPIWESPDIWIAHGDPSTTPATPPDHGGDVKSGEPHTVYAHVWNLGSAPVMEAVIAFYWANPSLSIDATNAHLIGKARVDLAMGGMPGCHKLVKCPVAWVPVMENHGHECLVVRVSAVNDSIGADSWLPNLDRRVAQRNITNITPGTSSNTLVDLLEQSRIKGGTLQLDQLSGHDAVHALGIVAPHLSGGAVATRALGLINATGGLSAPAAPAGPVVTPSTPPHGVAGLKIVHPTISISGLTLSTGTIKAGGATPARLHDLLGSIGALHPGVDAHGKPQPGTAQVLRLTQMQGGKIVGGYTLVISG